MPGQVEIGVDASGHAFALWDEQYGTSSVLRARRHLPGQGWADAVRVHRVELCLPPGDAARPASCNGFPARRPSLAVHPDGTAVAVWEQSSGIAAASFR
jgi:hypothetical protein